jgi:AcrR family transcriptional regulator
VTRPKTISDEALLAVARAVFRAQGRTASTRAIARQAGISEGILYQRFGTKEDLFFAAMAPRAPDIEALLGPEPPTEGVPTFLRNVLVRMAKHFGEVIPLAIQIIAHPAAHGPGRQRAKSGLSQLHEALAARLAWFEAQEVVQAGNPGPGGHGRHRLERHPPIGGNYATTVGSDALSLSAPCRGPGAPAWRKT